MKLITVDYDPFAEAPATSAGGLVPVEYDPFAEPENINQALAEPQPARTSIALGGAQVPEDQPLPNTEPVDRALTAIGDVPEAAMRGYYSAKIGANLLAADRGIISPELAAQNIAENVKKTREVPMPETVKKGMEELQKAKGWEETFAAMAKYPDVLPSVLGESAASSLLAGGTGAIGALTGAVVGSAVPVVGTAAGATAGLSAGVGIGSAATEYASTLNNFLTEKGYDTGNPEQLKAAFANPELMAEARKDAAIRGVAVGAFDALTAGVAGKLFGPVSKAFGKTPTGQAIGKVAGSAAEIGSQAAGGAGGEAAAQIGTKGEITSPSDVALEAAGEIVPGLGEIAIGSMTNPNVSEPAVRPTGEAIQPPQAPEGPLQVLVQAPPPNAPPKATEEATPSMPEEPAPEPVDLEEAAILKADGVSARTIAAMSAAQRAARAQEAVEQRGVTPAKLTEKDKALLEAPAAPPSPVPAVEARGPEAVIPSPSAPPAAPSEIATELVQQGVPPLEAMQQAVEQRQAAEATVPTPAPTVPTEAFTAPTEAPVVEPQPAITPVVEPEPVVEAPKAAPQAIAPAPAPKIAKPKAPVAFWRAANLDTLVRKMGGVKDVGGDLKAANVPRNLINNKNGRPIEEIALDAIERGYYPDFKAQLEASADTATGNYQPTKEMVERVKADIGTKKLHPDYQEDVEAAKREGEEQFVFGPYLEEAETRAKELSIAKDDPAVRAAATLLANGQAADINDAFDKILFADAAEIADDWAADRAEIAASVGDDIANEIDEFLAGEGFTARGKPLEADYEPESLPVSEAGTAIREEGEPEPEPIEEGRVEESRKEVAKPVSVETKKFSEILGGFIRQEVSLRTKPKSDGTEILYEGEKIAEIKGALTQEKVLRSLLEKMLDAYKADGAVIPRDPQDMTLDEFTIAAALNRMIPEFEINAADFDKVLKVGPDKTFTVDYRGLYDKVLEQEKGKSKTSKMAEDLGPQGKMQLVIPGAEKIGTKEELERKAAAPLKAKAKQKEPGGLFSDERFQQDLFSSVASKPNPKIAVEQKVAEFPKEQWLIDIAKSRELRPIFSDNKIGLILSYTTGNPIYYGIHRSKNKITGDISQYIGSVFTNEELSTLNKIRKEDLKNNMEAFNANPDGPFANGDIVISQNFPKDYGKIAEEWVKLANMPKGTRILFTTVEDAENMNLAHDYRYIHQARKELGGGNGVRMGILKNKEILWHAIVLKPNMPKAKTLESLSHEIGHVMEDEILAKASLEDREAIKNAYLAWKAKSKDKTVADMISNRAFKSYMAIVKRSPNMMGLPPKGNIAPDQIAYFFSFPEWFADQTARYFNSQEKALTVVDKFFKRLADALRRFYASIRGEKFLPDPVFKEWLDKHIESNKATITNLQNEFVDRVISQRQQDVFETDPTLEYEAPRDSFGSQLMYKYVDRFNDATAIKKAIEAARGAPLEESLDIEMALQLMPDKAIAKQNKIWEDEVTPALAVMKANNITADDMGKFMYALHAPERNARMAQRDPTRFTGDNGSGMTNQEAKDYMDGLSDNQKKVMLGIYKNHIKKMLMEDLKYRYDKGLIPKSEYDMLTLPKEKGGYEYYVPLSGYAEDEADATTQHPNIGRGFAIWGKEYKLAAGRESRAFNPLFSAIQKRMDGIVRVEKNDTSLTLYNLLDNYPNPEIAEIYTQKDLPKRPVLRADGTIQYIADFQMARAENTLALKIGGLQHFIVFNQDNPSSMRLVRTLKNMTKDEADIGMRTLLAMGRFMSKINTQWVPDFFLANFPRDVQDAMVSLYETKEGFASNFMKEMFRAAKNVKDVARGNPLSAEDKALYDEWIGHGGRLDFGGFETIEKTQRKLDDEFKDLWSSEDKTSMEKLDRLMRKSGDATLGAIERVNQIFDDAVRFAVYRAARRDPSNRFSPDRAAQLARRATVDFRQRGEKMAFWNALKPYLSAGVAGARRLAQIVASPRGRRVLSYVVMLGVVNSLVGLMLSDDDETDPTKKKFFTQVNDWERAKSLIIPVPINGRYVKINLGWYGLAAFGLGDQIVGVLSGNIKPGRAATNVTSSLLASFIPVWSGGVVDAFTPWVMQPAVELWTNKNWLGNPIYPERDTSMPQSSQAFESTPKWAKSMAELINNWSGGSFTEPGWADVYPATLSYAADFLTQSAGTFVSSTFEPFRKYMNGESVDAGKLPFVRRVTTKDTADRTDYYDIRNKIKADIALARESRKIIADPKMDAEKKRDARATLVRLKREIGISETTDGISQQNSVAEQFDDVDKRLKLLNTQIKQIQANKELTTAQKREQIQTREETKKRIMDNARKAYIRRIKNIQSRD